MIPLRIFPTILISDNKAIKTKKFDTRTYIGDPINSVKIFNDKEVDELLVLDIDATKKGFINFELLRGLAEEMIYPLSYGGGIKTIEDAEKIFSLGFEKIVININAYNYEFLKILIQEFGSQSISVCINIKKVDGKYFEYNYLNKQIKTENFFNHIDKLLNIGIGELIVSDVDNDGTLNGINVELFKQFANYNIPIVCMGGLNSIDDITQIINQTGIHSFSIGGFFVYSSNLNSVLLSYLSKEERKYIIKNINNGKDYV